MAAQAHVDCVIAGAGPVGLSAALALCDMAYRVAVADRNASVTDQSRAVGVNRRSLELLGPSGVAQQLLERAVRLRRVHFLRDGRPFVTLSIPGADGPRPRLIALPQSETERVLEHALGERGVCVHWGQELVSLDETDAGVNAHFRSTTGQRSIVTARALLGADGSRSATRRALGLSFDGRTLPEDWSLADATVDWPFPADACGALGRDGRVLFMITLGNGRHRLIGNRDDVLRAAGRLMTIHEVHWEGTFNVHLRVAEAMGRGRVHLAGDAAHTHSPVGGQGMNLGIADAFAFAEAFRDGAFDRYRRDRHAAARKVVARTTMAYELMTARSHAGRLTRDTALRLAALLTALLR